MLYFFRFFRLFRPKLRLLYDIHAFATDLIARLRRIAFVRLLPKNRTIPLDLHSTKLNTAKTIWPSLTAMDAKRMWKTTSRKNSVRDLFAYVRQSKADTLYGVSTRNMLARIFGDVEEVSTYTSAEEEYGEMATYIYYNTSSALNWCDDVEMEENEVL